MVQLAVDTPALKISVLRVFLPVETDRDKGLVGLMTARS